MPPRIPAARRTACNDEPLLFPDLGRRQVIADFSGGYLSRDGGALLLRQGDQNLGLTATLARAFTEQRDGRYCDHAVRELLAQRLLAEALGYDDVNDHDTLRRDPLLAAACGKREPLGTDRLHAHDQGVALAGPATLQRLERGHRPTDRYPKIHADPRQVEATLLDMGVRCLNKHAREIVLDLDSMGHLVHGLQEGRHFNACYDGYVLSPLYVFAGTVPLWAALRPGAADAGLDGVLAALEAIVPAIRKRCQRARRIGRGDSAFAREETLAWCEAHGVDYCLGLPRNPRLEALIEDALAAARARRCLTGAASAREFQELEYQTRQSWSRARRVVAKAEVMAVGDNPRFVVTNLPVGGFRGEDRMRFTAAPLYEGFYGARGDREHGRKQQVLDLPGDRMSTHDLAGNQLRLWLATLAYLLLDRLRTLYLRGSDLARATVGTIRLRLLQGLFRQVATQAGATERRNGGPPAKHTQRARRAGWGVDSAGGKPGRRTRKTAGGAAPHRKLTPHRLCPRPCVS